MIRLINIFIFFLTIAAYLSTRVSPDPYWVAGFLSLAIPILLLINILLLILSVMRGKVYLLFPLAALVIGYKFLLATFSFHNNSQPAQPDLSVLSYNVRVFNSYAYLHQDSLDNHTMVDWVVNDNSDIKCLQEFYNDQNSDIYNTAYKLGKKRGYYVYMKPALVNRIGAQFGLAIFSKYPIINQGEVRIQDSIHRFAVFADIVTSDQDTVRVFNVHLQSMSINENNIGKLDQAKENYPKIAQKLQFGFRSRAKEVSHLIKQILQSPYPAIVCGDFNDIPYSFTYQSLKKHLGNAFESAGLGTGFTYNGKLFFLRIDNQFFSDQLEPKYFQTYRDISFSDHFPIKAYYNIINTDQQKNN